MLIVNNVEKLLFSTVGRKITMALSAIGLVVFAVMHLAGNLQLFLPDGTLFNKYALMLHDFGWLLYVAEAGLAAVIVFHAVSGIMLKVNHRNARKDAYHVSKTKGGPSKGNVASRSMIISGMILLFFIIYHIYQFRFGPGIAEGYVTTIDGREARDLHRLVVETFQDPIWVAVYVGAMLFLAAHLRHGIWSMLQSLGLMCPRYSKCIYCLGLVVAVVLAVGFLLIPIWMYFNNSGVTP